MVLSQARLNSDSDGDGLPNAWMMQYFGHPTGTAVDKSRATEDADGDGMSNAAEYLAGTHPRDPSSNLRITSIKPQTNDIRVTWTTVPGKHYMLQVANAFGNPATNSFIDISPQITGAGTNASVTDYVDSGAFTNRSANFYRVRLSH